MNKSFFFVKYSIHGMKLGCPLNIKVLMVCMLVVNQSNLVWLAVAQADLRAREMTCVMIIM